MKITLLTMGKTDVPWVQKGLKLYAERLSHYVRFEICEIPELKKASAYTQTQIKNKEGDLLLKKIRTSDHVILLDEHGKERTSIEFAEKIKNHANRNGRDLVFVIGGAYGFSQEVYNRADGLFSLSKMTFSHQMVRTIFTEQLYRAFTILKGQPYHHE